MPNAKMVYVVDSAFNEYDDTIRTNLHYICAHYGLRCIAQPRIPADHGCYRGQASRPSKDEVAAILVCLDDHLRAEDLFAIQHLISAKSILFVGYVSVTSSRGARLFPGNGVLARFEHGKFITNWWDPEASANPCEDVKPWLDEVVSVSWFAAFNGLVFKGGPDGALAEIAHLLLEYRKD